MRRTVLGFLIAPAWVPAAVAAYTPWMFPYAEQRIWVFIAIAIAAIFDYGGSLSGSLHGRIAVRR